MNEDSPDKLDHSFEVDFEAIQKRAIRGIAIITGRGFVVNIISQISILFLLTFMNAGEMGVFWVVNAAVFFLVYFSDIGLAASLIQKKEKPTIEDLSTTFIIQQGLITLLLIILYFATPVLVNFYSLDASGKYLIYALGASLFMASLKSIPTVLMERKLEFGKMAVPDILENLVYSLSVVYFAWKGMGLNSFTYAVLIRGVVGVITIYLLQPFIPRLLFSKKSLKELFNFGVPYQINTLIAVVKDRGMTLVIGKIIGTQGVGFLGTAERLSQLPLRLFMDPVTKVSFPAFSRIQEHKDQLSKLTTRTIFFITFLTYPTLVGMTLVLPFLMKVIPDYQKWQTSLIPFYFMSINIFFASATTLLTNLLSAIGKIKIVTKLIIMWTILTFVFVPTLGFYYGVNGASAGYALVSVSSLVAIFIAKKYVNFSITESILKPLVASFTMGVVLFISRQILTPNFFNLVFIVVIGFLSYLISSYLLFGKTLFSDAKKLTKLFISKN